ncbi:hypothetical protein SCUCBS95973_003147 [Sporothrix curviconia]|uniref:Cytochrome P450 n=1 Tax=Sporothrix curviconia TaxID=1260050 RepID=A0ABP0BD63_9PEZI
MAHLIDISSPVAAGPSLYAGLAVFLVIVLLVRNYRYHGLNQYPGPVLARFTDLWRFLSVYRGKQQLDLRALHEQHGDVVRLGPNSLSFSSPEARRQIYGQTPRLTKSDFYPVFMQLSQGQVLQSLFGTQDLAYHAKLRRTVTSAFSMTSIMQYEPRVNDTLRAFLRQTERLYAAEPDTVCNFVLWLQYFAFDVVNEITYSRRAGFFDTNSDVDGIVAWLATAQDYQAPVGQMPWLDKILVKNPVRMLLSRLGWLDNSSGTARFSRARMAERYREMDDAKHGGGDAEKGTQKKKDSMDLLTMFLRAQQADPGFFDDGRLLTMTTSITLAGSDTTAASLAAVFYHLLKNPPCLRRLVAEIDAAELEADQRPDDHEGAGIFTYVETQKLPFLHAVIQESFRMHPSIGMVLERLTPPEGLEIAGRFVPGDTIVGCNPWVLHERGEIFGDEVKQFRPERWLVDPSKDPAAERDRLRLMGQELFHFGGGNRTCLGKNIALLEMYKLVPSFLRRFEVQLTTDENWDLHNNWFVKPRKFDVKIFKRQEKK